MTIYSKFFWSLPLKGIIIYNYIIVDCAVIKRFNELKWQNLVIMTLEEKNKEKRKNASLTVNEWFGFFLLPINLTNSSLFPARDFNDDEEDRFEKYGFDKKIRQSFIARMLGMVFYFIVIPLIILFFWEKVPFPSGRELRGGAS